MFVEFFSGYLVLRCLEAITKALLAKRSKKQNLSETDDDKPAGRGLIIPANATPLPPLIRATVLGPLASELAEALSDRIATAQANGYNSILLTDVPAEGYKYGWYTHSKDEGYALHGPIQQLLSWLDEQGHDTFIFWRYGDSRDFYYPWSPWPGGNNLRILITFKKKRGKQ